MSRIRTTKQAKTLRPLAAERARQAKFEAGQIVFYRGIGWYWVKIVSIDRGYGIKRFLVQARVRDGIATGGMFYTAGTELFADKASLLEPYAKTAR